MVLLEKLRVLVGALVHKPFAPGPEKGTGRQDEPGKSQRADPAHAFEQEAQEEPAPDTERVADLIARQHADDTLA